MVSTAIGEKFPHSQERSRADYDPMGPCMGRNIGRFYSFKFAKLSSNQGKDFRKDTSFGARLENWGFYKSVALCINLDLLNPLWDKLTGKPTLVSILLQIICYSDIIIAYFEAKCFKIRKQTI